MKPSEIRAELLGQHAEIRGHLLGLQQTLERWRTDPGVAQEIQTVLTRLLALVRRHNLREEELLRDILPTVDAWGPARAGVMIEQHNREHDELYAALVDTGTFGADDAPSVQVQLPRLIERFMEHMAHEEKIILAEDILCDDAIVRDYFGG